MTALATLKPRDPSLLAPRLNLDPDAATVQLLLTLAGDGGDMSADDFKALTERNRALVQAPEPEIRASLARQALVLEGLWLHYTAKALRCAKPDHAALLQKTALNCQAALHRTLSAIHALDREKAAFA